MDESGKWWEREIAIGIIYESIRDIGKPLRYMKHNAWGFCSTTTIKNLRRFSIYDVTTDENDPDYTCLYASQHMFGNLLVASNHNEKYETE
jgi:hypothetical protein